MKYKVLVPEVFISEYEVEASSPEEACVKAYDGDFLDHNGPISRYSGDLCLEPQDYPWIVVEDGGKEIQFDDLDISSTKRV